ncbi:glycosyltransferase family 4 protein [Limosilactobacillus mucosae]|uniref:glycosyltransferase family 4 protein n=1 Tax=Limosilactobacillus mucosae TaxID=97478 RepID=UPI0022DF757B|nr:glycosyltransferase [Limosilactobacillus mucosae]
MKLNVLTKNYGKGFTGATTATYELIERWKEKGIDIEIFTLNKTDVVNKNVKVNTYSSLRHLISAINQRKKETTIWYSDDHLGCILGLLGIKYVHTYHGNWPSALLKNGIINFFKGLVLMPLYVYTIKKSALSVTVSYYALNFVKKFQKHSIVVRNGISCEPIYTKKNIIFKNKPLKIIMVGNVDLRKYKNLFELIKKHNNDIYNFNIDVYGSIKDTKLIKQFSRKNIAFKGFKKNVPYKNYDIYLSLSGAENLSIAMVEAIESGIPVISLDVGGSGEVVLNNVTGFLIDRFDTDKVFTFLNEEIWKQKLNFDNYNIVNEFNWENSATKYEQFFTDLYKG